MAANLIAEVQKRVAGSGDDLQAAVVEAMVRKELAGREAAIIEALGKLDALDSAIRRLRPDDVKYDADGNKVSEAYSKAKYDELKKLREQRDKLDKLIDRAFTTTPDFAAMKKAADAVKGGKVEPESAESE
jgi:hypothetical protein